MTDTFDGRIAPPRPGLGSPTAASYGHCFGDVQKGGDRGFPAEPPSRRQILRGGGALLAAAALAALWPALRVTPAMAALPIKVVALGDSLTAGYMLPARDAFPTQLEAALRKAGLDVTVANAGVSGDTTAQGLARLDWSVPDGTDAVIVELGANDALRGLDPAQARANLDAIVTRLKERGIAVMLAGMVAPRNLGADYVKAFDSIYPDLARKHAVPLYPFFLEGVVGNPAFHIGDQLHPSGPGVAEIVRRILPSVQAFLSTVKPTG